LPQSRLCVNIILLQLGMIPILKRIIFDEEFMPKQRKEAK
jgi:hypothetical protein